MPGQWPDRPWVTVAELADIAAVAPRTVRREIQRGNLDATRIGPSLAIDTGAARTWAENFRKYDGLRKPPGP